MNTKFFSALAIVAVAFTLVFSFGAFSKASALQQSDTFIKSFPDQANVIASNETDNSLGAVRKDADTNRQPVFETYGLNGSFAQSAY